MFRLLLILLLVFSASAFGQDVEEIPVLVAPGEDFLESPSISEIIEGVGTIAYATAPVYVEPDKKSKLVRSAIPGEKVIILAANELWANVRMYNGRTGFVERRFLRTSKIFYEESVTRNYMDKRINVDITELVQQFNEALTGSIYAEKFHIIPRLLITNSAKQQNIITITLEYSAVDRFGSIIPSLQENMLAATMRDFLGLLYLSMLPANAEAYRFVILCPVFNESGQVLNMQGKYAEVELKHENVDIDKIIRGVNVFSLAEPSITDRALFQDFPH